MIQKMAILHCVYQMIASADGSIDEERDKTAIETALTELDLPNVGYWDRALQLNPHDSFFHVSTIQAEDKALFKQLILELTTKGGNEFLRTSCANHILQLTNC